MINIQKLPSMAYEHTWWVLLEKNFDCVLIGIIYNLHDTFSSFQVKQEDGRHRSYFLGDTTSLNEAMDCYRELYTD